MKKAIILLSGGQDSTTCLYWAKKKFDVVYAIGFNYGQMHVRELEQAIKISRDAKVNYKIFDASDLLAKSSLTEHTNHDDVSYINKDLPTSFTAGRNLLFLTIAASYGAELGVNDIIIGVCQTDFNGYPDCRRTTIDSLQTTLSLGMGNNDYRIHTPLMYLSKEETWRLAKKLNCLDIIINDTLTDYDGDMTKNEWGYGKATNPATKLRVEGYYKAKKNKWI